eukprot:120175-Pleurochrysis_carterae.AAC.2
MPVMRQVVQNAAGGVHELHGGARHGSAQHSHSIGHIGASLSRTVQQRPHQGLIRRTQFRWRDLPASFGSKRGFHKRRKILGGRCLALVERRGHSVRRVSVDQMSDVLVLLEEDVVSVTRNVYVEQVAHGAFIFHVPTRRQVGREGFVEGSCAVVGVESEEVIDVASDDE